MDSKYLLLNILIKSAPSAFVHKLYGTMSSCIKREEKIVSKSTKKSSFKNEQRKLQNLKSGISKTSSIFFFKNKSLKLLKCAIFISNKKIKKCKMIWDVRRKCFFLRSKGSENIPHFLTHRKCLSYKKNCWASFFGKGIRLKMLLLDEFDVFW